MHLNKCLVFLIKGDIFNKELDILRFNFIYFSSFTMEHQVGFHTLTRWE